MMGKSGRVTRRPQRGAYLVVRYYPVPANDPGGRTCRGTHSAPGSNRPGNTSLYLRHRCLSFGNPGEPRIGLCHGSSCHARSSTAPTIRQDSTNASDGGRHHPRIAHQFPARGRLRNANPVRVHQGSPNRSPVATDRFSTTGAIPATRATRRLPGSPCCAPTGPTGADQDHFSTFHPGARLDTLSIPFRPDPSSPATACAEVRFTDTTPTRGNRTPATCSP